MRAYVEIGRRVKWACKQYRCMEFKDHDKGLVNCDYCDITFGTAACMLTECMKKGRADKRDVYFRLEPRFKKEEQQ